MYIEKGLYHTMYNFTRDDISEVAKIWKGKHPDGAPDLVVSDDPYPTAAPFPPMPAEPQLGAPEAPGLEPGFIKEAAARIFGSTASS